jgi:hypothetical protein
LTGGANTLAEARKSYQHNITERARIRRQGIPPTVERLEVALAGMWVRAKVAAVHRDPSTDQMFLQTLLSAGSAPDALRGATGWRPDRQRGLESTWDCLGSGG